MARNPQDITDEERDAEVQFRRRPKPPRELTPLVDLVTTGKAIDGAKDFRPIITKLTDVGEPSVEELQAIEAGIDPTVAATEEAEADDDDEQEEPGEAKAPQARKLKAVPKG